MQQDFQKGDKVRLTRDVDTSTGRALKDSVWTVTTIWRRLPNTFCASLSNGSMNVSLVPADALERVDG